MLIGCSLVRVQIYCFCKTILSRVLDVALAIQGCHVYLWGVWPSIFIHPEFGFCMDEIFKPLFEEFYDALEKSNGIENQSQLINTL